MTKNLDLAVVKSSFKVLLDDSRICKSVYRRRSLSSTGNDYLNFIAKGYDVTQNGDLIILDKPGYIEYQGTGTSRYNVYLMIHVPAIFMVGI
jgi:hypothetical protein